MLKSAGIAVRVQGLRRYYGLVFCSGNRLRLVKMLENETTLAEISFPWKFEQTYTVILQAQGSRLLAWVDGKQVFDFTDTTSPFESGAIGILVSEGLLKAKEVKVLPA